MATHGMPAICIRASYLINLDSQAVLLAPSSFEKSY